MPLPAGFVLQAGDQLITGDDARVVVHFVEGGELRIGEDAVIELGLATAASPAQAGSAEAAAASLDVLQGALQLLAMAAGAHHPVQLRTPSMTAEARIADLWIKSASDGELVCVIEGSADIAPTAGGAVRLEQPMDFYLVKHDGSAPAHASTDLQQIQVWTGETALKPGSGVQVEGGRWKLELLASPNQLAALDSYEKLRHRGFAVEFVPGGSPQHRIYRVALAGLASEADARALEGEFSKWPELTPSVSR
jgi:hypothetical protein